MSTGLLALLDDVAAIAKVTAASLDDVLTQAGAASAKAAGVVIDDAAVTPKYVVGLSPKRELPIIWNIAKGSLKNKILYLTPAALLLGWLAPWAIKSILALGGLYLCFEGYEKLHDVVHKYLHKDQKEHIKSDKIITITPEELEKQRTNGAIRTDFILSAEIIAISYAVVANDTIFTQIAVLIAIAVGITIGVYGTVALLVKADDVGAHLVKYGQSRTTRKFGYGMIKAMPSLLKILGGIGTAAMLWVGGGIIIHSIPFLHHQMEHLTHAIHVEGFIKWCIEATLSGVFGVIMGGVTEKIYKLATKFLPLKFH